VLGSIGEYGASVAMFRARGLEPEPRAADELADAIRSDPPALVHVTHLASHRSSVQPLEDVIAACAEVGVPLWVDAAQSVGHLEVPAGAAAVLGTSRKWLSGPRGVGFVGVRPEWAARLRPIVVPPFELPPAQLLESLEAHVAGRVGLCVAVGEHAVLGPAAVRAALADSGARARAALDGAAGWTLAGADEPPSAIVSLRPPAGVDVPVVRRRLLQEHAILTTTAGADRAPFDVDETYLRVSPHVDVTDDDLEALASALVTLSG
jgi:pyridoxal 5-phosphate dependent beta-lyase